MADIVSSSEKDGQQGSEAKILSECDEFRPSHNLLPGHETNPPYLCHLSVSGCHWKGTYWAPSPLSLFLPPQFLPLSLFYFLSISWFLLTLLWQSAQPQGQRTEGLAGVFVMKNEKERGKRRDGQDGELEMGHIWHIVNAARQKWQFLCKLVEVKYFLVACNYISMRPSVYRI